MSNQSDPFSNSLTIQTIHNIDKLNLPIIQKHHLRILAHCLAILKVIYSKDTSYSGRENLLREWCDNQSRKFNDEKFNDILFEQLLSTFKKLNTFSQKIGKNIKELDIDDLVLLVQEN